MTPAAAHHRVARLSVLRTELRWLMRLRWIAGAACVAASPLGRFVEQAQAGPVWIAAVGAVVLAANLIATLLNSRFSRLHHEVRPLHLFAAGQILVDLACLTALTVLTGGLGSPILALYVFHMVFASLLLPRRWAEGVLVVTAGMLALGLAGAGMWPSGAHAWLIVLGWIVACAGTMYLAGRIAAKLFRRERARLRKNRRLRQLAHLLRTQQAAMIQHEKMAAMGRLAAGVAHEINNPLASMDGALQLMERNPDSPPRPATVRALRDQVRRIQDTVRELTAFAHPDKGVRDDIQLNSVVAGSLRMLEFDHRIRRCRVETDLAESTGLARAAPRALQQVVMNLALNALDAVESTPEPVIGVRTRREGEHCVIEVSDNGVGIPADKLGEIFEPFYTTKPVGSGTGLGLAISQSLIHEQGGTLGVSSRVGEGTTFTIRVQASRSGAAKGPVAVPEPANQ